MDLKFLSDEVYDILTNCTGFHSNVREQTILYSLTVAESSTTEEEGDSVEGPSASCMTPRPMKRGNQQVQSPNLVAGNGQSQLLGVSKLLQRTEEAQAQAVFFVLKDSNLQEKVQGMCFDTTSSNTGRHKVACIILQRLLNRHRILKLIAEAACTEAMGSSYAPDVLLFKLFKTR